MNLYHISQEVQKALEDSFDPETGELLPAFEEKRAAFAGKAQAVAAFILNTELDAAKAKIAIARIQAMQKAFEKKAERLREYLAANMRETGITDVKADDGSLHVKLMIERDQSVVIDPNAKFSAELCNPPGEPTPSKTKIKAALESGQLIPGAMIVKKDRLQIK